MTRDYNRSPEGEARAKLYNSRKWRNFSKAYLAKHPECELCPAKATITDHAEGHAGDWQSRFWIGPFRPVCRPCNSRESHKSYQRPTDYKAINERREKLRNGILPGGYRDSRGGGFEGEGKKPYTAEDSMENRCRGQTRPSRDQLINRLRGTKK